MRKVVGIDRKIKRAWLDKVLDQLVTMTEEAELRAFLDRTLKEGCPARSLVQERRHHPSHLERRPQGAQGHAGPAVALLARISGQERIWLHWG